MSHHSKHSPALVIAVIMQLVAIVMAFSSFFLPIYRLKFSGSEDILDINVSSEVEFKYRTYQCSYDFDSLSNTTRFTYDQSPGIIDCLPFLSADEDMSRFGYYMKASLATLALGFIGSVITLIFTIIMSCHRTCRNWGMKIFSFIFSLVPFVFYLASPLVLFALTTDFYKNGYNSSESGVEKCGGEWCSEFIGSDTASFSIPGLPNLLSGSIKWGPTYGWASGIVASVLALVSAILTVCSARYKKHEHDGYHRLVN